MAMSNHTLRQLKSKSPLVVKEAIKMFVDRVEIDPFERNATVFVHKVPRVSTTYNNAVSVNKCRRSDLNRHDVAIAGF